MSAMKTTLRILSSLKTIVKDDFRCPICLKACTYTLASTVCGHRFCGKCIKAEGVNNLECPTCRVPVPSHRSCRADLHFDGILNKVMTELIDPLEMRLLRNSNKPQKQIEQMVDSPVKVAEARKATKEVHAQNQVNAVVGKKRNRSSQEQQLSTTVSNENAMHNIGNNTLVEEQRSKVLKTTNEAARQAIEPRFAESTTLQEQQNTPSRLAMKNPKISELLNSDSSQFQQRIEMLTAFKAKFKHCNVPQSKSFSNMPFLSLAQWCSQVRCIRKMIEEGNKNSGKDQDPFKAQFEMLDALGFEWDSKNPFEKRFDELMVYKAKFGHCNANHSTHPSNRPYHSLAQWCSQIRVKRKSIDNGSRTHEQQNLSKAQIETLDALGFLWEPLKDTFAKNVDELRKFKAKFGHCNVSHSNCPDNKPYLNLAKWCSKIRYKHKRRLVGKRDTYLEHLSQAQFDILDAVGFLWEPKGAFERRFEELRAFEAKFGHCNVTHSSAQSNQQYTSLAHWCFQLRIKRKLIEDGKTHEEQHLSKAQIAELDTLGFNWESRSAFEKRIDELKAFKAIYGHCNVGHSTSQANRSHISLEKWCNVVRASRNSTDDGKPSKTLKLSQDQIESLNALGFQWELKDPFEKQLDDLKAFKEKFGHCNVKQSFTLDKSYNALGKWCSRIRCHRKFIDEGIPTHDGLHLSKAQIERLDVLGFQWKKKSPFEKRLSELKAFKAKFGHCNVSHSKSISNRPYTSLAGWCDSMRHSRKQIEEGNSLKAKQLKLSQHQIEKLDALGFTWTRQSSFDRRYEELKAFKAKFGHCNVSHSTAQSNKPYTSLAQWCTQIRLIRKQLDEGKIPVQLKVSQAQIERLDDLGFRWKVGANNQSE